MTEEILQPMMIGTTLDVKKALLAILKAEVYKTHDQWRIFTAELWSRGVSKEDFIAFAKEQEQKCQ